MILIVFDFQNMSNCYSKAFKLL